MFVINLHLLTPAFIAQIFNPTAEDATPIGTPTNEDNAKIETQPLAADTKEENGSLKPYTLFDAFHSLYLSFHLKDNFLLHLFF